MSTLSGISYVDEFDSKEYLYKYYAPSEESTNLNTYCKFYSQKLRKFYKKYNSKWNNQTAKLLEFAGGPSILSLISAAPYVGQITFSAYLESERKEIELWKHAKEGAHDWSAHFKYAVNELEQTSGDDAWRKREELLRKRISSIIACDIFCDNPLITNQEQFDIVSTCWCLEVACTTYEQYKATVKKLVGLLKPGGFLLMYFDERSNYYIIGKKKWFSLYLTLENVEKALTEAGTAIIMAKRDPATMKDIQNPLEDDLKASVFIVVQKVEF